MENMHPVARSPEDIEQWFDGLSSMRNVPLQVMSSNYYEVLGVDPAASPQEIRKAYTRGALRWHPDKWATAPEEKRLAASERFKLLANAHEVLKDPSKRAAYDEQLKYTPAPETPLMTTEKAWEVFIRVTLESVRQETLQNEPSTNAVLKLIASLSLPALGFYFGGQAALFASSALSLLLLNPSRLNSAVAEMSDEQKREFYCAVFRLSQVAMQT